MSLVLLSTPRSAFILNKRVEPTSGRLFEDRPLPSRFGRSDRGSALQRSQSVLDAINATSAPAASLISVQCGSHRPAPFLSLASDRRRP